MVKTIAVVSLKGGVGKTSVVSSLGGAVAGLDKRVLLVDGNFSAPNLGLHFNLTNPDFTLHEVLMGKSRISDAIHVLEKFDVLPSRLFHNFQMNVFKLRDKLKNVHDEYDYIFIDSSPSLNDETLAAMLAADEVFVVTTADYSSVAMVIKAVKMAKQRGTNITGLILNKVHGKGFEIPLEEIEDATGVPVLGVIPHDLDVIKAQSEFVSPVYYNPKSKGSKEFVKLAEVITGERKSRRGFFGRMRIVPKKHEINREIYYKEFFG